MSPRGLIVVLYGGDHLLSRPAAPVHALAVQEVPATVNQSRRQSSPHRRKSPGVGVEQLHGAPERHQVRQNCCARHRPRGLRSPFLTIKKMTATDRSTRVPRRGGDVQEGEKGSASYFCRGAQLRGPGARGMPGCARSSPCPSGLRWPPAHALAPLFSFSCRLFSPPGAPAPPAYSRLPSPRYPMSKRRGTAGPSLAPTFEEL